MPQMYSVEMKIYPSPSLSIMYISGYVIHDLIATIDNLVKKLCFRNPFSPFTLIQLLMNIHQRSVSILTGLINKSKFCLNVFLSWKSESDLTQEILSHQQDGNMSSVASCWCNEIVLVTWLLGISCKKKIYINKENQKILFKDLIIINLHEYNKLKD